MKQSCNKPIRTPQKGGQGQGDPTAIVMAVLVLLIYYYIIQILLIFLNWFPVAEQEPNNSVADDIVGWRLRMSGLDTYIHCFIALILRGKFRI